MRIASAHSVTTIGQVLTEESFQLYIHKQNIIAQVSLQLHKLGLRAFLPTYTTLNHGLAAVMTLVFSTHGGLPVNLCWPQLLTEFL